MFPILLFKRKTGAPPDCIEVFGWNFKRERFDLFREALQWPAERYSYHGVNDPPDLAHAEASEARVLESVRRDPLLQGGGFEAKRRARDPFGRGNPYGRGNMGL